jgi:hypothetical protein
VIREIVALKVQKGNLESMESLEVEVVWGLRERGERKERRARKD